MEKKKIPAIQGRIGNTTYYIANLTFKQISELVKKVDSELHTSNSLKEQIQRSLSNNFVKIKNYILSRNDHFFNSLVLAVYDGEPKWTEIRYEMDGERFLNVGLLELSGQEKVFPVDGQHRVEGIKAALLEYDNLATETIPVMIIGHSTTPQGMERSRRIFSTLNRYAKPVRLGDIIALDEDDIVAIVTRDLLENYPLFRGKRIKANNTKSIPPQDKDAFTSLMTLYDCHIELYKVFYFGENVSASKIKDSLRTRPEDNVLDNFNAYLTDFWNEFISKFSEMQNYIDSERENSATEFRSTENGGNILFRPISLFPLIQAIVKIKISNENISFEEIIEKFVSVNRTVSAEPWIKVIWDPTTRKMIMRNQALVLLIFVFIYDRSLLTAKEKAKLFHSYALIHNISDEDSEVRLNHFIL